MSEPEYTTLTSIHFGELFARYRGRFEIIAHRYVRNMAVAEDLVSDSFMAFWENRERIKPPITESSCAAYILTIVRNKCLDHLRAQSLHLKIKTEIGQFQQQLLAADIHSLEAFDPQDFFTGEINTLVKQTLDALPELTRNVFITRRFDDKSYREIALQYGITERRVEFELVKATKQLRHSLKDYLGILLFLIGDMYL